MIINEDNASTYELYRWSAFASDLGWQPGRWPRRLETTLGNKQPFVMTVLTEAGGLYKQANGCLTLRVHND